MFIYASITRRDKVLIQFHITLDVMISISRQPDDKIITQMHYIITN